MITPSTYPFGAAVFCDDIRFEMGNKISLVGAYPQGLQIPHDLNLPVMLPKLGIIVFWNEDIRVHPRSIRFKAFYAPLNDDPFNEDGGTLLGESMEYKFGDELLPPTGMILVPGAAAKSVVSVMILSPVTLPYEGKIRVRAYRDDEVRLVGAMSVTKMPTSSDKPIGG
jgi:hypothetical protein